KAAGSLRPPGRRFSQMCARVPDYGLQPRNLCRQYAPPAGRQPVVFAPPLAAGFIDQTVSQQPRQIVVERPRSQTVAALRLTLRLLHDAVSMEIFRREREEDMQGGGRQGEMLGIGLHARILLYRNPSAASSVAAPVGATLHCFGVISAYPRRLSASCGEGSAS